MDWSIVMSVVGGINLMVVIRVAFQTGKVVQKIDDMDRRITNIELRRR